MSNASLRVLLVIGVVSIVGVAACGVVGSDPDATGSGAASLEQSRETAALGGAQAGAAPAPAAGSAYTSPILPVFMLEIGGDGTVDETETTGTLRVIEQHDGTLTDLASRPASLQSRISIEIRGEMSAGLPKKSYDIELLDGLGEDRDVSLLGLPAGSDWVLHGCGRDETCLRNALVYGLGRELGQYAPRTRFIELFIENQYRGLYVLTEKIRPDRGRVDLPRPAADAEKGDITGGYIFKMDLGEGSPGDRVPKDWVSEVSPMVYSYHYPRYDDITEAQKDYLQDHVARFETMMQGSDWDHPSVGYPAWLDVPSWVDFALLQEFSNNVDAYFKSVYLQKWPQSRGGRIALGPLWDFDASFGVGDFRGGRDTTAWAHEMNRFGGQTVPYEPPGEVPHVPAYWERLWTAPDFQAAMKCRWEEARQGPLLLDEITGRIDAWVEQLSLAQPRDAAVWNNPSEAAYPGEVSFLKTWLTDRLTWMDANLPGDCP